MNKNLFEYIVINPEENTFSANQIDLLDKLPLVSFCIPTKNNEKTIEKCLYSIVNQNYPNFEIVIDAGDSKKLASSILFLKSNPAILEKFGINGRKYAESYFSLTGATKKYIEIFKKITN